MIVSQTMRKHTAMAIAFPLAACVCLLAFKVLRGIQLSQPDPFRNPYANISTAFMVAFVLAWLATPVSAILLRRTVSLNALVFSWTVFAIGAMEVGVFLVCMIMFLFP